MPEGQRKEAAIYYTRRSYAALVDLAQNPSELSVIRAAAGHPDVVQGIMSEDVAQAALANIAAANRSTKVRTFGTDGQEAFRRGQIVHHKPSGRKVTVIRASAARKEGERCHEVIDAKSGKKFLARESNLKA
jgi:hypothetical protein